MEKPEENEELTETLDFTKPDYVFTPNGRHEWRQQGPYIVCKSCPIHHASYIGMSHILTGINSKGDPILKKI